MSTTEKGVVSDIARGADWLDDGNGNFSQLRRSADAQWGYKASTTTGLTYGYFGGQAWTGSAWSTVADGTTALTDNTTNYVERTLAGVVSVAASLFTASKIPMAIVVTASGVITTFSDARRELNPSAVAYTDENAQDAVGGILDDATIGDINFTYNDGTPKISGAIQSDVALGGNPTTTTQSSGNSSTRIATTAFVADAVAKQPEVLMFAVSDETTSLTTGTDKITFRMPFAMTLTSCRASVTTAPTGSTIIVDIEESGTTIFSTKLTIDATEKTSTTATTFVFSDSSLADDAEITVNIDQVGSTIPGAGLKIALIGTRT
jgi:hypothetical protein